MDIRRISVKQCVRMLGLEAADMSLDIDRASGGPSDGVERRKSPTSLS